MARIKLGALVSDIRGKIGNVIYSLAKGGVHYAKNAPAVVTNPNSADQALAKRLMQEATKAWTSLSDAYKSMWATVAARCAALAKEPGGGVMALVPAIGFDGSGFNAYCAFRTRSLLTGVSLANFDIAWQAGVATEQQPTDESFVSLTCVGGTVTSTVVAPVTCDPAARIAVWGRTREPVYHKQIMFLNDIVTLVQAYIEMKSGQGNVLPFSNALGARLLMQMQTVNPSGWASPGSLTREVVLV